MSAKSRLNNSEAIQLYQILVDRVKHEGTVYWVRFSAFFLIVSALTVAWARGEFLVKCALQTDFAFLANQTVRVIVILIGGISSVAWLLVNLNGAAWQEYFNLQIRKLEDKNPVLGYTFSSFRKTSLTRADVMGSAILLSALWFAGWIVAAFFFNWILGLISFFSSATFVILVAITYDLVGILTTLKKNNKKSNKKTSGKIKRI